MRRILMSLWLLCLISSFSRGQVMYTITDLGTLGGTVSNGLALNDSGQVTGVAYLVGDAVGHAFLYSDGKMSDLGTLGGTLSQGTGINAAGQVTGQANTPADARFDAFLYTNGQMIDLGTLGGSWSIPNAINDKAQVAGYSATTMTDLSYHAFVYSNNQVTDLGTLGCTSSLCRSLGFAMNSSGQVTGWAETPNDHHAFVYSGGTMIDLGSLTGSWSYGRAINASGQVTGSYIAANPHNHAFLYSNGQMVDLGTLGGSWSDGLGINLSGQVVGTSATTGDLGQHAFMYAGGQMHDLGTLGGTQSAPKSINDAGHIVGYSTPPGDGTYRAFLYSSNKMIDLNSTIPTGSGWVLAWANAINNNEQITGWGYINGQIHAFLLSPHSQVPSITSLSHNFGTQGETISNFAVDGENFGLDSALSFSDAKIRVNSYNLRTDKLIVASITIDRDAVVGPQNAFVTHVGQTSYPFGSFTVLQPATGQIVVTTLKRRSTLLTPGEKNKLSAKVTTDAGRPISGVNVTFTVTGANPSVTTSISDTTGTAKAEYNGLNEGTDTIIASAVVGEQQIQSSPAFTEWGTVTIAFKMPLPRDPGARWKLLNRVDDPNDSFHKGNGYYSLDFRDSTVAMQPPILSAADGNVTGTGVATKTFGFDNCPKVGSFGTHAILDHGNGFQSIYAHFKAGTLQVAMNDSGTLGQVLGIMDNTGCSTGTHLHFQVRYNGTSARNDHLRIFIEDRRIEEYCVTGRVDFYGQICTAGLYSSSNNGLPFGVLDGPKPNSSLSGIADVAGWVLDDGSVSLVDIQVDEQNLANASYGTARQDVCDVFSWFATCPNVGFRGKLDTLPLSNGKHTLRILVTDNLGAQRSIGESTIRIANH